MGALATILASIITSLMTILAALAALVLFGGRRAAIAISGAVAKLPAEPAPGPTAPTLSVGPSTHFSVHKARLEFLDSPARVGRPCRVRFEWILYNGAHSYITYRSRVRAEGQQDAEPREVSDPPATAPRGTSYQQRIVGEVEALFTWDQPGVYVVRARVKAAIEGTPFTYQFEVERRGRVVVPKLSPAISDDVPSV
jgi:hypothetical protein